MERTFPERSAARQTPEDQHFNWDTGTDLPGDWIPTSQVTNTKPHQAQPLSALSCPNNIYHVSYVFMCAIHYPEEG